MMRKEILVGAATALLNVGVFWLVVPLFLNRVHHHGIVPAFCAWLLLQSVVFTRFSPTWSVPALRVVMGLGLLTGAILFWRQFSMFQCFQNCERHLIAGLLLLALSFAHMGWAGPFGRQRSLMGVACVFALWSIFLAVASLVCFSPV